MKFGLTTSIAVFSFLIAGTGLSSPLQGKELAPLPKSINASELQKMILEPMPDWYTERFTRGHLNIEAMMAHGLSRLQAVEIQNQMKDILSQDPEYLSWEEAGIAQQAFQRKDPKIMHALQQAWYRVVVEGYHESGFYPGPLNQGAFYAVFDMDETLLNQWYSSGEQGRFDLSSLTPDFILRPLVQGPRYVSMIPGWQEQLQRLLNDPACAGVFIFTAKADSAAHDIVDRLTLGDKPLRSMLKGVFTRHHLTRSSEQVKLSKDLRIIDESLQHVVLVDDNPTRILPKQYAQLKAFPKYHADAYYQDQKAAAMIRQYLPQATTEILEAADYARRHQVSFASAYFPYSYAAAAPLATLLSQQYSLEQARDFLRGPHAEWFEPPFFIPQP